MNRSELIAAARRAAKDFRYEAATYEGIDPGLGRTEQDAALLFDQLANALAEIDAGVGA